MTVLFQNGCHGNFSLMIQFQSLYLMLDYSIKCSFCNLCQLMLSTVCLLQTMIHNRLAWRNQLSTHVHYACIIKVHMMCGKSEPICEWSVSSGYLFSSSPLMHPTDLEEMIGHATATAHVGLSGQCWYTLLCTC